MIGKTFGLLAVIEKSKPDIHGNDIYKCLCRCGHIEDRRGYGLRKGKIIKCSKCYKIHSPRTTHGMSKTSIYGIWSNILSRCLNINDPAYINYGGRGITVCDRWLKFENFYADMGQRPNKLQIDRIDNDGNYSPDNCRWVTAKDNSNNRRIKEDLMPGKVFGRWLVLKRVSHHLPGWYYTCRCGCGNEKIRGGRDLRRNKTMQCKDCQVLQRKETYERKAIEYKRYSS